MFAFAAAFFVSGCHRATESPSPIGIDFEFAPRPPHVGPVTLSLNLADVDARPVTGAKVMLEGDMSHPGMAPVFAEAREIGSGLYQAHLDFKMAGDWIILAHIKLVNGRLLEHQLELPGIRPN